jgi:hypothetical protein
MECEDTMPRETAKTGPDRPQLRIVRPDESIEDEPKIAADLSPAAVLEYFSIRRRALIQELRALDRILGILHKPK